MQTEVVVSDVQQIGSSSSCSWRRALRPTGDAKNLSVSRFVETDDQRPAHSQCGCSQIAGRAEDPLLQRCGVGLLSGEIDVKHLLAFGCVKFIGVPQQFERFGFANARLFGIEFVVWRQVMFRKKLLRLAA